MRRYIDIEELHGMSSSAVQEIGDAIDRLTTEELQELYSWLDQHHPQPIDARLNSDLAAGRLDKAIFRALDDEQSGRIRPF
jgi:hypothetical protein